MDMMSIFIIVPEGSLLSSAYHRRLVVPALSLPLLHDPMGVCAQG